MLYYIIKTFLSAGILVTVSEISKRSTLMGSILASLPLVSILAMIWLYVDSKDSEKIAELSTGIFWLVLPSLSLFIALPVLLKNKVSFYLALFLSITIMVLLYFLMLVILKKFGIKI